MISRTTLLAAVRSASIGPNLPVAAQAQQQAVVELGEQGRRQQHPGGDIEGGARRAAARASGTPGPQRQGPQGRAGRLQEEGARVGQPQGRERTGQQRQPGGQGRARPGFSAGRLQAADERPGQPEQGPQAEPLERASAASPDAFVDAEGPVGPRKQQRVDERVLLAR